MGLDVFFFIGAFVLLVALIFGTLQWHHYRSRRSIRVGDELVRNRYKRNQG